MMPRFLAIQKTISPKHQYKSTNERAATPNEKGMSSRFGKSVFSKSVIRKMLPKEISKNLIDAMDKKDKLRPEYADAIASAMKEWAISLGATHYTHWFHPLTGASAEKHDAFIDWSADNEIIDTFSGKQLIQGEPDASSFPSGGLRSTYEARGYTGWDPSSSPFIWRSVEGATLCIPSVFFSWTGHALDSKIPLLRSDKEVAQAALRLLKLTKTKATQVSTLIGLEQEYFVVDRALRNLRPDLLLVGRTLLGAASPKGQEMQDHYFGAVKERILNFMHDFEVAALDIGIPLKTRHNEVAPAQHEVAAVVEKASIAIDHNIQLMELMRQIAIKHNLACLLHEKPFEGLNGSGKHCNWSLSTDTGINLLDPNHFSDDNPTFLITLTAILKAVHDHAALLRASIGSAANDMRLGGHEAPPAIISVYLGSELEGVLDLIENIGRVDPKKEKSKMNLGIIEIPELSKDNTDRNRTSPFAFTGNKFEFRAMGSSADPSFAVTVLNVIVAESLNEILDDIEQAQEDNKEASLIDVVLPILKRYLINSKNIRFSGDNYSKEWLEESTLRGLPNIEKSIHAFRTFLSDKTITAFKGVLSESELHSRYEICAENYANTLYMEMQLLLELFNTQVLPLAMQQQKDFADAIKAVKDVSGMAVLQEEQLERLKNLVLQTEKGLKISCEVGRKLKAAQSLNIIEKAEVLADDISVDCQCLRDVIDYIENIVDDRSWMLPKYRELLFMV